MPWRKRFEPLLTPLWQAWFAFSRRMTLGARVLATNERGEVLLIRHTYKKGWELPGGGIERGELAGEAAARELLEEAGIEALEPLHLVSIHSQEASFKGDHVLFYVADRWRQAKAPALGGEIEAIGWFAPDALPEDITPGSRRRIGEALLDEAFDPRW